ncbi:galactosylceramide sulfotransferase-like [Amphiura filiformis]|uniref:galactosylceramide sulfotransferase-like n=1 Tax=Amphiura filiformis TaxID=82378 RepID=UPI003B20DF80
MVSLSLLRRFTIVGGAFFVLLMLHLHSSTTTYRSPALLEHARQSASRPNQYIRKQPVAGNTTQITPNVVQKADDQEQSNARENAQCLTVNRSVIFVKTHKTGSSTVSTTFIRYADEKHLKIALPIFTHIFHEVKPFHHRMVLSVGDMKEFNVLANHARYNKHEMDQVVDRAIYVTIIRNPVQQFESAFSYFGMAKNLGLPDDDNALDAFLQRPEFYFYNFNYHMRTQSWNGQMFDLGVDHEYHLNDSTVEKKILQLDKEIDLVMLKEYFDHSMVLLRRLLCWDWMDVIYIAKAVRAKRFRHVITNSLANKIQKWNSADVKLYDHFNRTFWRKVQEYGSNFYEDLQYFRELNHNISEICLDKDSDSTYDKRVDARLLKSDAPDFCHNLKREEVPYIRWIKWRYVCHYMLLPSFVILIFICASVYIFKCWYCNSWDDKIHGVYEPVRDHEIRDW